MLIAWPMFLPQWNDYIDKSHIEEKSGGHKIHLLQMDQ